MAGPLARMHELSRRFGFRLVAAMLVVALPLVIVESWVLTSDASTSLTSAGKDRGVSLARSVVLRLETWLEERREGMIALAAATAGDPKGAAAATTIKGLVKAYGDDYSVVELADLAGRVVATSDPKLSVEPAGTDWFHTAASGQPALTSITRLGDRLEWIIAQPIVGAGGRVEGVALAGLRPEILASSAQSRTQVRRRPEDLRRRCAGSTGLRHRHGPAGRRHGNDRRRRPRYDGRQ